MAFKDFDIEVQNQSDVVTEHIEGTVTTAGTPVTITATGGKKILQILVINQKKGTNANTFDDLLLVNTDGGSVFTTVQRKFKASCYIDSFRIDANNNGVKYEVVIIRED
jgi:hypothetical protein